MADSQAKISERKNGYYVVKPVGSIRNMLTMAKDEAGDWDAYQYKLSETEICHVTYREFYDTVENLGAALHALGLGEAHIACIGENSYPWIVAYLTVLQSAGVFVPMDKELPAEDIYRVINDSDSTAIFYSKKFESILLENRERIPSVRYFIGIDREENGENGVYAMKRLIEQGQTLDRTPYDSLKSDEYALKMLVYISGTNGLARGVMLSEHNLISGVYYGLQVSQVFGKGLSVLPYNHTYEAVCDILISIHKHTTLCINDALKSILRNLRLFKPDYVYLVPAFLELFYSNMMRTIRKQGKEEEILQAIKRSNEMRKVGIDLRSSLFRDLTAMFGGNLKKIVCGGAAIRPEIGKFFGDIGIWVIGGYGITECSPLISVNDEQANDYRTVGRKLPCLEWKIDEPNGEGIGEICVKGDVVMLGYYKQPDRTAEVLSSDGWFRTGDYGYLTKEDWLVITGRKKSVIVLSNGKNVYPEEIEAYILQIGYIAEVVVRSAKNEFGQETHLTAEVYLKESRDPETVLRDIQDKLTVLPNYKMVYSVEIRNEPFAKTATNQIIRNKG